MLPEPFVFIKITELGDWTVTSAGILHKAFRRIRSEV